jgi:capsule polysaccharide export protein KpsE/RkpR
VGQYATKTQKEFTDQRPVEDFVAPDSAELEAGIDMVAKARSLWDERRLISRIVLACLLGATLLAFLLPKRYNATSKLMPPDNNQSNSGLAMIAAMATKSTSAPSGLGSVAGDLLGMKSSGALFLGILSSETVQDRITDRFDLRKVYGLKYREDVRKQLNSRTAFDEDRKSGIISLTVADRDPQRAAAMAGAYVEELNKLVAQLSTSSAHKERVFLEERLVAVKRDLDQASQDFSQFSSKNKTLDIKEEARAMLQGAATLEGQLIALESQLRGLQAIYTDNNVRVRSVQARIAELHKQLDSIGGPSVPAPGVPAASGTVDSPTQSQPASQSQFPSIRNLPILGATYADLYRRMTIQEAVYEVLTQQYELAKVQEAKEIPSVKVLDAPQIPEKKSFPPRLLIIATGGILGLVGASVFVFGREHWSAVDSAEPGKVLVTEVLQTVNAQMPWSPPSGPGFQENAHRVWTRLSGKNGTNGNNGANGNNANGSGSAGNSDSGESGSGSSTTK